MRLMRRLGIGSPRAMVVATYTTPREMERGLERMRRDGYELSTQSGEFSRLPRLKWRWQRKKVIVTFRRREDPAPPFAAVGEGGAVSESPRTDGPGPGS
jgi:hypothetical protein